MFVFFYLRVSTTSIPLHKLTKQHSDFKKTVKRCENVCVVMFKGMLLLHNACWSSKPLTHSGHIQLYNTSCCTLKSWEPCGNTHISCLVLLKKTLECMCVHRCRVYLLPQELSQINRWRMGHSSISSVHRG